MREYDRKRLLERIERAGSTIGASIPDTIELDGDTFELQAFVFETKRQERVSPERQETVDAVKRRLRRAKQRRVDQIEAGTVSEETGERLAEEVIGIDRALTELESLDATDLEAEVTANETADRRRWLSFLDRALGRDSGGDGRRNHGR
ncbi:MAG: DUF5788 family protein [Halobacteriaceae archaeon]